jgi:DNA-directed RNA polymerase specialized sigma24 family protein
VSAAAVASIEPDWAELVRRIRLSEDAALSEFFVIFSAGMRRYLCRMLGTQDLDDHVHDCFMVVTRALQTSGIRQPERLMGFTRVVVKRKIASYVEERVRARTRDVQVTPLTVDTFRSEGFDWADPETVLIQQETKRIVLSAIAELPERFAELLTRFYFEDETEVEIRSAMHLTYDQFRNFKSRAKAMLTRRIGDAQRRHAIDRSNANCFLNNVKPQVPHQR